VASTGLGLRLELGDRARLDLVYAVPLSQPLGLGEPKPQPRVLLNVTGSLSELGGSLRDVMSAIRRVPRQGDAP
jgi:hypothetical protein